MGYAGQRLVSKIWIDDFTFVIIFIWLVCEILGGNKGVLVCLTGKTGRVASAA